MSWHRNHLLGIVPVIVNWTQKVSSGIVVEASPSLVFCAKRRFGSWCALHEPVDDQYFEPAGIISMATVSTLSKLNPPQFIPLYKAKGNGFLT